jgi:hypothetical protein
LNLCDGRIIADDPSAPAPGAATGIRASAASMTMRARRAPQFLTTALPLSGNGCISRRPHPNFISLHILDLG